MKLSICVKCSDRFSAVLTDKEGEVQRNYDGYVPSFMPDEHYGDYVMLDIDTDTGKILNWKKPTKKQMLDQMKENT